MTTARALFALAAAATTIAWPAPAHADADEQFQSPSGHIYCMIGVGNDGLGHVVCEGGRPFVAEAPPGCHLAWGDRFSIEQGNRPVSHCHGDTIFPSHSASGPMPGVPVLAYGTTQSAGTITCDSERTGMTCTDSSTGHYFRISQELNEIG